MAEKNEPVKTGHYSYYADKVLVLGKDGINMASTTNPLPVDAIVTVDSMDIYAEMKTTTGADFYVTTSNVGDDTDTIAFDSVAANVVGGTLTLEMIQAGATRIGASASVQIIAEQEKLLKQQK